ncbi:DUF2188 domain-containing protein [Saccharibacillus alkalitolerans]|uniref:DUF2188 domain-containing protein n=1 Tax=Saccharibacillus alkalitolerans TaxID=2705290 RepID=A0ABX0F2F8_9BACL|nr:DUF2188 domain-containing protein [Saccharibacillus alkalitolerans]NGZ74134.1 DUF2188 domain-containing protein [Saccharibacillus alkalitolerans]
MPWNKNDYPQSMKNLDERVRDKAIEIANALLDEGYEEGRAIAIATSKAEEWDENHPDRGGKSKKDDDGSRGRSGSESKSSARHPLHVVSHEDGWAVKEEGTDKPLSTHSRKDEAVKAANDSASDDGVHVYVHDKDGKIQS